MTYTIASYETLTITQPLSVGTNIEFLNDMGTAGVVIFTRGAIEVTTISNGGTYTGTASFGGTILNFLPPAYGNFAVSDQATIQVFESLFNAMDITGTDEADFAGHVTFAAQTGNQIILTDGTASWSAGTPFTLTPTEAEIIDEIAIALFGTDANTATLDLAFTTRTNPNANHPFIDGVFTAYSPVNENSTVPCFAAGTRILTPRGDVPVEELNTGDLVITAEGEEQPVIWVGIRHIDNIHTLRRPERVRPIIIEAGALAENTPSRTLALSPDHALFIDNLLVPAKELVNWNNIHQDHRSRAITYYHLELPRHAIIFAESAAVETYLDTGHRGAFDNDSSVCVDHPTTMQQRRETQSCAPFCGSGPQLDAIRTRITARQLGIKLASGA